MRKSKIQLRNKLGLFLIISHLAVVLLIVIFYLFGGFSFEELTTTMALIIPLYTVYTIAILKFMVGDGEHVESEDEFASRVSVFTAFFIPSLFIVCLTTIVIFKVYNIGFFTFDQFKLMIALTETAFGAYIGIILSSLLKMNRTLIGTRNPVKKPNTGYVNRKNVALPHAQRIFISYRRKDSADITGRIYDKLVERFGRENIYKDVDSNPLGINFEEHTERILAECEIFIAVIGDRWLTSTGVDGKRRLDDPSDHVRIEIESALKRGIPVIPVLVRGSSIPSEEDLPSSLKNLSNRNGIAVRPDPDFHFDMNRLIKGLEAHLDTTG